jgi:cytochrome bd-type quinol oxidase subunit 2
MTRFCAVTAPALLLAYGILRWVDGLDGHHKGEPFWSAGHVAFFIVIVLFGALAFALDQTIRAESPGRRTIADAATAATIFGAACFLWVILGDLSADFRDAAPLPDPLQAAGPALFQIGLLTLLVLLVVNRPRRLPVWSPVLVLLGFAAIAIDLDLLPVASVVVGLGLYPLAIQTSRRSVTAAV